MSPRHHTAAAAALAAALLVAWAPGCTTVDPGYPPVARLTAMPGAVPENDGFQSPVVLDATTSADPIDDPEGQRPLRYRWELGNALSAVLSIGAIVALLVALLRNDPLLPRAVTVG